MTTHPREIAKDIIESFERVSATGLKPNMDNYLEKFTVDATAVARWALQLEADKAELLDGLIRARSWMYEEPGQTEKVDAILAKHQSATGGK